MSKSYFGQSTAGHGTKSGRQSSPTQDCDRDKGTLLLLAVTGIPTLAVLAVALILAI